MTRKCKLTGEEFYPKRSNMVFKSAAARVRYHNNKANKLRREKSFVDAPLRKNKKILDEIMNGSEVKTVHKQFMLGKGFSFSVFTHYQEHNSKHLPAVYDYVIISNGDIVKVAKIKNN